MEVWDSPPLVVIVKIMRQDRDVVVEADTWYKGSQLGCHLSDNAKEFGVRNGLLSAEEGADLRYELAAIVKHFGTPGNDNPAERRSGHYNVLIRVVGTDEYWTADDETVTNKGVLVNPYSQHDYLLFFALNGRQCWGTSAPPLWDHKPPKPKTKAAAADPPSSSSAASSSGGAQALKAPPASVGRGSGSIGSKGSGQPPPKQKTLPPPKRSGAKVPEAGAAAAAAAAKPKLATVPAKGPAKEQSAGNQKAAQPQQQEETGLRLVAGA